MEQRDRQGIATFFAGEPIVAGRVIALGEGEAQHVRVRRIGMGERVRVADGAGALGEGPLVRLTKSQAMVEIESLENVEPPAPIHLMAPIADRDRMLWLAEKATELGIASWRPVMWRRSRGVSPRGEGVSFHAKTRLRMIAALTQSGGAWLPALYPDAPLDRAVAACSAGVRWLLDAEGESVRAEAEPVVAPLTIAVGPEGGIEPDERSTLLAAGFVPVKLASLTLRFETAGIAGVAVARMALERSRETVRG